MGWRSSGAVRMWLTSRIPVRAISSVLGIGVAVRVRTSTPILSRRSWSLAATPKRCSSSITTRPRFFHLDILGEKAMGADHNIDLAGGEPFHHLPAAGDAVRNRLRTSTLIGYGSKRSVKVW